MILSYTSMTFLVIFLSSAKLIAQVVAGTAPVTPPAGNFRIEGNLQANTPVVGVGDWIPGPAGAGGNVLTAGGVPLVAATTFHFTDPHSIAENNFAGGKKFNDNPNTWTWVTNPVGAKCDINNALYHFAQDGSGQLWLIVAADRKSDNGSAYIDFEFLQKTMTDNANGTFSSAGTQGGRTVGDFILTLALTNGGGVAEFFVNRWQTVGAGYDYVDRTALLTAGTVYGATNSAVVPVSFPAFGVNTYPLNCFAEGAVNLSALLAAFDPCTSLGIKTLFIKTKTSPAASATIVDFISTQQVAIQIGGASAGADQSLCSNSFTVTGSATPSAGDGIASRSWSVVPGSGSATIASPTAASTSVTVTSTSVLLAFAVTTNNGCVLKDTVQLTVKTSPTVTVNSPTICAGQSAQLTATHNAQTPSYLWSTGATTSSINVSPGSQTQYTVTVTDGVSGCSGQGQGTVNVNPVPDPPGVDVVNHCDGTSTLTATSYTGTLLWSTGETTASIVVNSAGTYTVTQTVTGCTSGNGSGQAAPKTTPPAPGVDVVDHCDGTSTLTATGFTGSLLWSTGETTTSIVVNSAGPYSVIQTVDGCPSSQGSGNANPGSAPEAPTVDYNPPPCDQNKFSVTIGNVQAGATYAILDKDGNTIPGVLPGNTYLAPDDNDFDFSDIPAGSGYQVSVSIGGECSVPGNSCGVNDAKTITQSTNLKAGVLKQTTILAYPNPFTDVVRFRIESSVAGNASLDIFNVMGQKIKNPFKGYMQKGEVRTVEVYLPNAASANLMYIFRVGNDKLSGKLLKL